MVCSFVFTPTSSPLSPFTIDPTHARVLDFKFVVRLWTWSTFMFSHVLEISGLLFVSEFLSLTRADSDTRVYCYISEGSASVLRDLPRSFVFFHACRQANYSSSVQRHGPVGGGAMIRPNDRLRFYLQSYPTDTFIYRQSAAAPSA